jgi:hypothetical protein
MSASRDVRPTRIPVIIYDKKKLHEDFMHTMQRINHRYFLKLKKDEPMIMLKHSLIFDGRFYGAENLES